MREIEGLVESFKEARMVYLTTFRDGEERSRQMTNFNGDPYDVIWFPSEMKSRKVEDIKEDPKVLITFPAQNKGDYYEITGRAELADEEATARKWRWWYLYWHPSQKLRFWMPGGAMTPERAIINVNPVSARLVKKT
ncbi:pyridoxamine 5'-phosphate oxidase family protein [Candidatus Bathyarchaeota archaeon]|nr:pyridoxamine 5'-phosphate oxidase family protein [Candidatus Bathyarchaeota archaeon]